MTLLSAATAFFEGATDVFNHVEESTDVPPEARVKGFGPLIGLKSKTFEAHNVTGADFAAARADPKPSADVRESLRLLDSLEERWNSLVAAIEAEVASNDAASPRIAKGMAVEDIRLPTASDGEWTLSDELQRGNHVLLVVLRHFG